MTRRRRLLAINLNPHAATRQGIQRITRALRRRFDIEVVERHFARVDSRTIRHADAVVLGPQGVPFDAYGDARSTLEAIVQDTAERPTLGICGGCQAMVIAAGGAIGPIGGGAAAGTYEGHFKHVGWREVRSIREDPLLPLGAQARVRVSHVEATTRLPERYVRVATSDYCDVQMIREPDAPRWGVQFHPELGGDGTALLERFVAQFTG